MNNIPTNLAELFGSMKDTKHGDKLFTVLNNIGMGRDEPITRDELAGLICKVLGEVESHIEKICDEKNDKICDLEDEIDDLEQNLNGLREDDNDYEEQIDDLEIENRELKECKCKLIELCLKNNLIVPFID